MQMTNQRYLLMSDLLMRIGFQMGYTTLLILAYNESHKIVALGLISIGLIVPSFLFIGISARIDSIQRAWGFFIWSSAARIIALGRVIFAARSWWAIVLFSAF